MLSVKHNLVAGNASRQYGINEEKGAKSTEKLSSGYRINRSADDAAGLSISEKMRRQIRGLSQASTNSQDGISMVQTAEGALNEVHDMLQRANELAVKGANGTFSDLERAMIDDEVQKLKAAIDESGRNTTFNGIHLFPEDGASPKSVSKAAAEVYHYEFTLNLANGTMKATGASLNAAAARAAGNVSTGSVLADTIANELVPNAVKQILDSFPALKANVGSDTIDMSLDVSYLDGPNNTLAYAQYGYTSNGRPVSMLLKVDVADFEDADADGTGARAEALESTIAHELMHSVMQYTLTDGMSGRKGDKFPTWFVEGTAQLSGGGFPTGWNETLKYYAGQLTGYTDTTQDSNIKKYLQDYTVDGRPYGHGYLAAAYAGYLANGGTGAVTGAGIAAGMNQIFAEILSGKSFAQALQSKTGYTESGLKQLFASGNQNLVDFVRKLSVAAGNGAGSVVAPSLADGGTNIIGTGAPAQPFRIDPGKVNVNLDRGGARVSLQVGGESGECLEFQLYQMSAEALGLGDTNTKTQAACGDAIDAVKEAIGYVGGVRSAYGAIQNRLEHTISNLDNIVENTTAAESRIRDTDMADEMVRYSNYQIILQAGQSMMAQANRQTELVMGLLQ